MIVLLDACILTPAGQEKLAYIAGRLLFTRLTLQFGWTGDESKAGGRVCVMGVMAG
jgi:hypothetical protein